MFGPAGSPIASLTLRALGARALSADDQRALANTRHYQHREIWSDHDGVIENDPLPPSAAQSSDGWVWLAEVGDALCGFADLMQDLMHPRAGRLNVYVMPALRMRGIGSALFAEAMRQARRAGIRSVAVGTVSTIPGEAFLSHRRGVPTYVASALEVSWSVLDTDGLRARAAKCDASGLTLTLFEGAYPASVVEGMARLKMLVTETYGYRLAGGDVARAMRHLRREERQATLAGTRRWTACALDAERNTVVGYNEFRWSPGDPDVLTQSDGAVDNAYRTRSIGIWMRAALLDHLTPTFRPRIRTLRVVVHAESTGLIQRYLDLNYRVRHQQTRWRVRPAENPELNPSRTHVDAALRSISRAPHAT